MLKTDYVAGFLIDRSIGQVALIRKNHPEWQRGLLNAIGGKIELNETPKEAMRREFMEEATLDLDWYDNFLCLQGEWGRVEFFRSFTSFDNKTPDDLSKTDEQIELWEYDDPQLRIQTIPNLSWILPLAVLGSETYQKIYANLKG